MEHPRITVEPSKMGGAPCIRGMRMTVESVVYKIASGMSVEEIIADHPSLEKEDIRAALIYAGESARLRHVQADDSWLEGPEWKTISIE